MRDKNMNNISSYSTPSFSYCYLAEAIAPYHCSAITSSFDTKPMQACSSPLMELDQGDDKPNSQVNVDGPLDKRRKGSDGSSCLSSSPLKSSNGGKSRKQKMGELKKKKGEETMKAKLEEPPNGYIHVRARRGQATDNHSLAERVRREKISERMRMLQSLVPGCDKVTGKAHMLDEIINYVQSLQNQVEFLSMRLASTNPVFFEYAAQLDEIQRIGAARINEQVSHGNQSNNVGPSSTALDYQMFFNSSLSSLLQSQIVGPTTSFSQDGGSDSVMVQEGFVNRDQELGFENIFFPSFDKS